MSEKRRESYETVVDYIADNMSREAVLEQLAEECAELAHAALKLARIRRGENPTPVTEGDAESNLLEEVADVDLCITVMLRIKQEFIMDEMRMIGDKSYRWYERIKAAKEDKGHVRPPYDNH